MFYAVAHLRQLATCIRFIVTSEFTRWHIQLSKKVNIMKQKVLVFWNEDPGRLGWRIACCEAIHGTILVGFFQNGLTLWIPVEWIHRSWTRRSSPSPPRRTASGLPQSSSCSTASRAGSTRTVPLPPKARRRATAWCLSRNHLRLLRYWCAALHGLQRNLCGRLILQVNDMCTYFPQSRDKLHLDIWSLGRTTWCILAWLAPKRFQTPVIFIFSITSGSVHLELWWIDQPPICYSLLDRLGGWSVHHTSRWTRPLALSQTGDEIAWNG